MANIKKIKLVDNTEYDIVDASATHIQEVTLAQWNALTPEQQASGDYVITDATLSPLSASLVPYDNTTSGLSATNVQDAIDEIDTGLSSKQDKSTLLSDIVKKVIVSGTTNSTGDIVANDLTVGIHIIISATKARTAANSNIGFSSLGRNYTNDKYIIHLADASGTPLANQSVEVVVHYINIY